jgi:hypothetical protein
LPDGIFYPGHALTASRAEQGSDRSRFAAYRNAETLVVAIPQTEAEKRGLRGAAGLPRHDEVAFTAAEIGDQIVSALERRITTMTEELQKLGVEAAPRLREV